MSAILRGITRRQSGMMPTPAEIAALGGIGMPGSAANQQAAQQAEADDKRYYEDVQQMNEATLVPGMTGKAKAEQRVANGRAASYGPMDGSKPPAEAFLPRKDFEVTKPEPAPKAAPKSDIAATNAYEAALLDLMKRKGIRMADARKLLEAEGVTAPPGSIVTEEVVVEDDPVQLESDMGDAAMRRKYDRYVEAERQRAGRLKELGMMHENQETVLPFEDWWHLKESPLRQLT